MSEAPRLTALAEAAESLLGRIADEFHDARLRGERPSIDELAERHPHLADVIRQVLPAMLVLPQPTTVAAIETEFPGGQDLGDFRILREIGRGGMGVVYEALQHSLGRRVALKVLPLAGMLDQRRLQRFHNETHAAAALQHPHIVPVFGVGCERGVHYYAMQLIRGVSLAEVLQRLRSHRAPSVNDDVSTEPYAILSTQSTRPSERFPAIAQLGIQAAEALAYAHREGVIHRDVKPSNLLLDDRGKLWIADFGLARMQADGGLTLTGDVLGTLRYMSPEQLTNNKVVDQRTDVYSLGLTLYEVLAGEAAFADVPREQLAQRILTEDPRQLRKADASIPNDLETIILKAIAKDRDIRYQSADALASDLRRFIDRKPILARRPSRWQRVRYWARRNPALATTVATLFLAMATLSIGGPAMAWRQRQLADAAVHNLFISDMNLAYNAWYRGHVNRVEELLEKHATRARYGDSRDFAYFYLQGLYRAADNTVLLKRDERFEDIAISPDGQTLAAGGQFPGVLLVDLASSRHVQTLRSSDAPVESLDFSPDGTLLIASGGSNVLMWDAETWQPRPVNMTHAATVMSLRFAPDSQTFATGTFNGELTLWDRSGQRRWSTKAHQSRIDPAAFSPDGRTLATASEDHHVKLWDAATGELKCDLARLGGPAFDVAWARDGKLIIVAGAEGIQYWDPESGIQLRGLAYSLRPVASLAVHDDLVATGEHDHLLQFWDVESGLRLGVIVADRAEIMGLAFTPDGDRILAAGWDGTVRRFDLRDVLAHQEYVKRVDWEWMAAVATTADGSTCVSVAAPLAPDQAIDDARGELAVWDVASGLRRRTAPVAARFGVDVALSHDARICASAGWGGVQLWDLATAMPNRTLVKDDDQRFWTVAVSPDGRWLAAGGYLAKASRAKLGVLRIWDLSVPSAPREVALPTIAHGEVMSLDFAADSRQLAVAGGDWVNGTVDIWTYDQDRWHQTSPGVGAHGQISTDTAFVPGTAFVATSGWDGVIGLHHLKDPRASREYRTHIQAVFSVAVSADGKLIASGADREIRLWDRATGDQLATIEVPIWVNSLAFTPDGNTLIWGGGDGTVNFLRAGGVRSQ